MSCSPCIERLNGKVPQKTTRLAVFDFVRGHDDRVVRYPPPSLLCHSLGNLERLTMSSSWSIDGIVIAGYACVRSNSFLRRSASHFRCRPDIHQELPTPSLHPPRPSFDILENVTRDRVIADGKDYKTARCKVHIPHRLRLPRSSYPIRLFHAMVFGAVDDVGGHERYLCIYRRPEYIAIVYLSCSRLDTGKHGFPIPSYLLFAWRVPRLHTFLVLPRPSADWNMISKTQESSPSMSVCSSARPSHASLCIYS